MYTITKTPYAFFAKITLCMHLLYALGQQVNIIVARSDRLRT